MGLSRWLEAAGVDPEWFYALPRRMKARREIEGEPRRGRSSSQAGVREDVDRPTLSGRYAASDGNGSGRARGDERGPGDDSRLAPADKEGDTALPLSTARRRLLEHSLPHETVRPVPHSSRRLHVVR